MKKRIFITVLFLAGIIAFFGALFSYGQPPQKPGIRPAIPRVQTPKPAPGAPAITGYKEKCGRKGGEITVLGRNFGSRAAKGVALGGHGIHVDFNVVSWSDTKIVAKIPDDPKIKEGQWYYIGVEKADHTQWLSNINKNITICSVQMKPKKMKVKPKISKAYIRGYIDGCMHLGHTYEECAERSKIIPRRMTKPRPAPMAMELTPILSQFFYGCHAACRDDGKSTEECNKQCRGLEEEQKEQEEQKEP